MKKIITLLVLMCSLSVVAQEYTPLDREGVKWECMSEQIGWWEMEPVPFTIYFKGDTIVNDVEYKKCYFETDTAKFVAALMREDIVAKQVFVYYPESLFGHTYNARIHIHILDHFKSHQDLEKEYVLYDFNNIYNSAMIAEWKSVTNITNESFISVGDKQCKRTRVTNNSSANSNTQSAFFSLVEGVGFVSEIHNKFVYAKTNRCIYEGIMLDFLSYDQTNDGWEMITYFNRLVADDGTVLYESPNTYTPLVREGVKWNCFRKDEIGKWDQTYDIEHYHIEIQKDTIFDDVSYKKCYYVFESPQLSDNAPFAYLREDVVNKKVFARSNQYDTYGKEFLLYDFADISNPNQEWVISLNTYNQTKLESFRYTCSEIGIDSQIHKMHTFTDGDGESLDIIEGIGLARPYFKEGGDLLHNHPKITTCSGCGDKFYEFLNFENEKGEKVYESPDAYNCLLREGLKWKGVLITRDDKSGVEVEKPYYIEIKGDSIVDWMRYKKCFYIMEDGGDSNNIPRALLREDIERHKVFAIFNSEHSNAQLPTHYIGQDKKYSDEVVIYDFSNIDYPEQNWMSFLNERFFISVNQETSTIKVDGTSRGVNTFKNVADGVLQLKFIEGIGLAYSQWGGDLLYPVQPRSTTYTKFCYLEDANGEIIYVAQEYNSIEGVTSDKDNATETARYDLYGRRLNRPTQGVNIIKMSDGTTRKEMVK